jgi:beta-1,2-mannobiose phosphorylase / 1,2-beta-oligomannan phosphorylase
VTFIKDLDCYVMAYVAHGPKGPRIAVAVSHDAYEWKRLGLVEFAPGLPNGLDKDAAFFPELVFSPSGVLSFAMYHRPTLPISTADLLGMPLLDRESTRIAYIHADPVLLDRTKLLEVSESACVLEPVTQWGQLKTGAGTPPVQIDEGWLSVYHAVDAIAHEDGRFRVNYQAGLIVHDLVSPHIVRYRSPEPILSPETSEELHGVVNNVVFPTAIDVRADIAARTYDIYYGMADARIGLVRLGIAARMTAEGKDLAA